MAIRVTCSACEKTYNVDDSMGGKKIRCRECKEIITVPAEAAPARRSRDSEEISERKPVATPQRERDEDDFDDDERPRKRRERVDDDYDDDRPRKRRSRVDDEDEDDRPRRRKKKGGGLLVPLLIGGGVGVVLLIAVVVIVILVSRGGDAKQVAQAKPPMPNAANIQGQPQAQPQPQIAPVNPGVDDLGEKVLPVNQAPNDAPLRAIKGIPLYRLSDLRVGAGRFGRQELSVHYERVAGEEKGVGPTLVIRTKDGNEHNTIGGFGPFQGQRKAGDIVVSVRFGKGLPADMEVYLIHNDRRWEGENFRPRFKVSNSVVMGVMGRPIQYAREWTPEETAKINNAPPEAPQVNANANVGQDTEFIGNTVGLLPAPRYADANKRPVIGVLYLPGQGNADKDGPKIDCLVQLSPAYDQRQPRYAQQALFAKPGYALGGLNVKTKKVVVAVQAIFMKQKPDGTLDPADKYTSNWLGHPEVADQEGTVSGNGRKVIGMHLKHFGAVHAVALVLE